MHSFYMVENLLGQQSDCAYAYAGQDPPQNSIFYSMISSLQAFPVSIHPVSTLGSCVWEEALGSVALYL
jgi:hypothetical protein